MANPLHVAVDGSRNGDRGGFAVVFTDPEAVLLRHHYGPCTAAFNPELLAIEAALLHCPPAERLVVHTDYNEAIERLVDRVTPRRPSANEEVLVRIDALITGMNERGGVVEFAKVHQASQEHPHHAVAHFLAFVGRVTGTPHLGALGEAEEVAARIEQILAAESPNEAAHRIVKRHLFPASRG